MESQQQMTTHEQTTAQPRANDELSAPNNGSMLPERPALSVQETVRMIYTLGGGVVVLLSVAIWLLMHFA